jgi:hypothetical protein
MKGSSVCLGGALPRGIVGFAVCIDHESADLLTLEAILLQVAQFLAVSALPLLPLEPEVFPPLMGWGSRGCVDHFDLLVIVLSCAVVVLLGRSHHDSFGSLVVSLDDFQIQGNFVDSLEDGIHVLHDLLSDGLMKPSNEHLSLEKISSVVDLRFILGLFLHVIGPGGLGILSGMLTWNLLKVSTFWAK